MTSIAACVLTGPVGWVILGAEEEQSPGVYTCDCWKPVLHDDSPEPSNEKLLRDVVLDPRVKQVTTSNNNGDLPNLILKNVWGEQFRVEYVCLGSSNQLAAHAIKIVNIKRILFVCFETVVVTGAIVAIPAANGVLATGAAAGAISGAVLSGNNAAITTVPTVTTVAAASAVGGAASAMMGSVAATKVGAVGTGVVQGAAVASITGFGTGAGVASAICGAASLAPGMLTSPVGWCVLGATEAESSGVYTFDCWKQILHDDSCEPSNGRFLRDVVIDPRIKQVTTATNSNNADLPNLVLKNIWDEHFRIEYVYLKSINLLAAHAVKI
ncbi:unnamed protein product [Rotaria sp. Silwood2]|nr:unnamed protein product [Rotaria sp. Silwood2]CAF4559662.1 unnamed protein product [Rotaria sp. Silwood2]